MRTATQRSKKGSAGEGSGEGFWGRVLRVLRRGFAMGFAVGKGSGKGFSEGVLRRCSRRCLVRPLEKNSRPLERSAAP